MADADDKNNDTKPAAVASPSIDTSIRHVFSNKKEITEIYNSLDDYNQFELIEDDVCLDPHDEDNNHEYVRFRSKDGSRLTREIVDNDFILVGFDKCGLSAVLNMPVPPGATLSVQMSTWCNPCHSGHGVEKTSCFGIGMVPAGCGKEQMWSRGDFQTCIEDGVQYYAALAYEKMMFGGGGGGLGGFGGGGLAALLAGGSSGDLVEYSLDAMQGGVSINHSTRTKMSLEVVDVRIRRDLSGESEFSFSHGEDSFKVKRPADANNKDMQLYFNCLGWADNNTYVQIHKVVYDPPPLDERKMPPKESAPVPTASKKRAATSNEEADFPDYAKILKTDPELRKQVDELIRSRQES